eukprot:TRINITY_DN6778_c0_g3_i1.p1 TRINITY_DN6778_c0_g3~~TRINITY_DN6778_c0_g3_i1.p1  ORF type:complete len:263 (+),score=39.18 TRINITY_DN6778_c0_g3_i1:732-1520(+)
MKRKLFLQLPDEVRKRVEKIVDIDIPAAPASIRKIARQHLALTMSNSHRLHVDMIVQYFLDAVASADSKVKATYGDDETAKAFDLGAVQTLIVSCQNSDRQRWEDMAVACNVEAIVVDPCSNVGVQFCKGYGVGALLRWHVDTELLEADLADQDNDDMCKLSQETRACCEEVSQDDSDDESTNASTVAIDAVFIEWLEETLKHELDEASASSLTICAEVILSDMSSSLEDRVSRTVELLRDEGIPEAILIEVQCHSMDLGLK